MPESISQATIKKFSDSTLRYLTLRMLVGTANYKFHYFFIGGRAENVGLHACIVLRDAFLT